ncbi:MAG: TetR/AcrR family transcriptional regulator [Aggregatilineales bacterium]
MSQKTPRERRHQRTRDAILSAAVTLIRVEGADKLSLRAIAREIDYSPAGLYEYFGSKDDIINAVCQQGNDRLIRYLKGADATQSITDHLVNIGLAYVRFAHDNPEMFTLMFSTLPGPDELPEPEDLSSEDAFTVAYQAVQAGIDAGIIAIRDDYDTLDIAYSLWAFVHGMAVLQVTHLRDFAMDYECIDRQALQAFIRGLAD